jgi:signal transduction histidine kinase
VSLRRRFILVFAGFAVILSVLGGVLTWTATRRALESELNDKLRQVAGAAAEVGFQSSLVVGLRPGDENSSAWNLAFQRLRSMQRYVASAYLFKDDRSVLVSTEGPDSLPIGTQLRFLDLYGSELEQAMALGSATTPLFQGVDGRFYKYGFVRLEQSNVLLGVLMRAEYLEPLDRFRRTVLLGSLAAVFLAAVLAGFLAAGVVEPLERLSRVAIRIQRGHLSQPVDVKREDELGRLSKAMERMRVGILQRDEQLRLMLAQVAHEIRNPLGGLELFAAAASETEDPGERARILSRIREEVEGLNHVINDFLVFARPLAPSMELHDVRPSLESAAELVRAEQEGEGTVSLDLPGVPLLARADPGHVRAVALNLLRNAAQAGPNVELDAFLHRGEVVVTVRDDGSGVPPALRDRIFEPFVTDKEQGAGLGLAIVKRLVDENGGRVELTRPGSPGGAGAEFRVYFPGPDELPVPERLSGAD